MKIIFKINFYTYLFLLLSLLAGVFREIIFVYIIILIHELGHLIIMKYYKINIKKINVYPYGCLIDSDMLINTNSLKVLIISSGGILIQLLLFIIVFVIFKLGIIGLYFYTLFNKINFSIIVFNLLPIYPLDGFKLLNSILELLFSFRKSMDISIIINILFIFLFIIYLYMFKISNYIIITFLLVSFINYIKNIKYVLNKFYLERIIYNLKFNGLISVKDKESMYKNKYNYISGIGEKYYLKKT